MNPMPRRVVTGLNEQGKSCIIFDGVVPDPGGSGVGMIWRTDAIPADNAGNAEAADRPFDFEVMHSGGSAFLVVEYPPGMGQDGPMWHATDTIDYIVVLAGEVVLAVESDEVTLCAGDFFVDRGVVHAWRNDGDAPARIAVVNLPAEPVGKGRTV
ncbi:MAG: cupin domain-containing protein [Novosphingobium sp.]|nr:cupin domain-containing protein [Novosphingobium sp.]